MKKKKPKLGRPLSDQATKSILKAVRITPQTWSKIETRYGKLSIFFNEAVKRIL